MATFRLRPWFAIPAMLWAGVVAAHSGDEPAVQTLGGLSSASMGTGSRVPVSGTQADFSRFWSPGLRNWAGGSFSIPFTIDERRLDADRSIYSRALSIQWHHRADAENRYTVTARRDNARTTDSQTATANGVAASLAWQRALNGDTLFISRLLLGDEETRTSQVGQWARRYYGMEFEGRYQLMARHAPFASFVWQRSDYGSPEGPLSSYGRRENRSRFTAGWSWQPLSNWDFRAEANLRLSEDGLDPADNDRSRLYFSTQYGFR